MFRTTNNLVIEKMLSCPVVDIDKFLEAGKQLKRAISKIEKSEKSEAGVELLERLVRIQDARFEQEKDISAQIKELEKLHAFSLCLNIPPQVKEEYEWLKEVFQETLTPIRIY